MVKKLVPDPFIEKLKFGISLDQQSEMLKSLLLLYAQGEVYQNILKVRCWPLTLTLYKVFLKNRKRSGASLPTKFFAKILKKNNFHAIFY